MTEYASLRGWDVESTVSLALRYSDQFFTHYIYRRAARKEKERHIVSLILFFRMYRSVRKFFSWEPHISRFLLKKEKHICGAYVCKYDKCELREADYQWGTLTSAHDYTADFMPEKTFLVGICAVILIQKCRIDCFVIM